MPLKTPKQRNQKQVYQSAILIQLNQTQTRLKMANRITNLRQTPQMTRLKGTRNFRMVWKVCPQIYRLTPRMVQSLISAVAMRFNKSRYNYISWSDFWNSPMHKVLQPSTHNERIVHQRFVSDNKRARKQQIVHDWVALNIDYAALFFPYLILPTLRISYRGYLV